MDYKYAGIKRSREESTEEYEPNKKMKIEEGEVFALGELPKDAITEVLRFALQCNPFLTETCKLFHDAAKILNKDRNPEDVAKFGAYLSGLPRMQHTPSYAWDHMRSVEKACEAAGIKKNPTAWKFDVDWMVQNGCQELVRRALNCRFITIANTQFVEMFIAAGDLKTLESINPCGHGVYADEKGCHYYTGISMKYDRPECMLYFIRLLEGKGGRYLCQPLDRLVCDVFITCPWLDRDSVSCLEALWNHAKNSPQQYPLTISRMERMTIENCIFYAKKCALFLIGISTSSFSEWAKGCLKNDFPEGLDKLYKGLQFKRSHCPQTSIQGVKCAAMCGRESEGLEAATADYWIRNAKTDLFEAFVSEANERVKNTVVETLVSSADRDNHFLASFVKIALDHGCSVTSEARVLAKSKDMFAVSLLLQATHEEF